MTSIISNISSAEKIISRGRIKNGIVDDLGSISKIASSLYYQSAVLEYMIDSRRSQQNVKSRIFSQINKDFGSYTDMQARSNTSKLHHVYEWKRVGQAESRLWKLNKKDGTEYNMTIDYSFKRSRVAVPSDSGTKQYVFREKARIMEFRIPVTIRPRTLGGKLAFKNEESKLIVLPRDRSVLISRPGGANVFQGFARTYQRFFVGPMLGQSIEASGVTKAFNRAAKSSMKIPSYISSRATISKISPSALKGAAKSSAERGARKI